MERYAQAKKVTIWGAISNIFQGIIKVIIGIYGNSHALFADGLHSFSDVVTDGLVIVASRYGSVAADANHPYGHQRFETAATMLLSFLLVIVGVSIAYDSLLDLHLKDYVLPDKMVMVIALLSVLVNEFLFHYTKRVGIRIKSDLVIANAWHHRGDAGSSLVVLLGTLGAWMGFIYFDRIAAIIVGVLIVKMGANLAWSSVLELVDTGAKPVLLARIKQVIRSVPGVLEIHQLRTRSMGNTILVDVHVLVENQVSVSEGHHIAQQVHDTLLKKIDDITDVTVHIDPENDEEANLNINLPMRQELLPRLEKLWQNVPNFSPPDKVTLHYMSGQINLELCFNHHEINPALSLNDYSQKYTELLQDLPEIGEVSVYFY